MKSMFEAIDALFKAYFVFDLGYPPESCHLLLLIQKGIYRISTKSDESYTSLQYVMKKLHASQSSEPPKTHDTAEGDKE